jgi:hypothetical protein
MMKTSLIFNLAVAFAVLSTGCGRDSVKVYHVDASDNSTPPPPPASMPASMPAGLPAPDNSGLPSLKYVLPAGWEKRAPTQMRVASFGVSQDGKQADVSVIPLAGMAGTDPANVNRWRGQVGLQPLADDDLQKLAEKVEVAGQPADLYDMAGTVQRILAVILHRDDATWFFKMTGDADLVEKQKPAFVSFLKSFQFGESAAPSTMDLSKLPEGHPPIAGTSLGTQNSLIPNANTTVMGGMNSNNNDKPTWTVPAGWQPAPLSQFLIAKFSITAADGAEAAVNVSSLAGDGGGLAANVNRWRAQLGLQPIRQEDEFSKIVTSIDVANGKAQIVDFTGTDSKNGKPARLVGAIVPQNGQTWFYKLMGDENIVAQQKDALIKFVQSAKYPDAH